MKKFIGVIAATVFLCTTVLSPVHAETKPELKTEKYKVVKVYESNTDGKLSVLEKRNITHQLNAEAVLLDNQTGEKTVVSSTSNDVVKTRDLQVIETGEIVTEYAINSEIEVSGSGTDDAISVKATAKLFITLHGDTQDYVNMEKVEYKWAKLDSRVSVSDKKIQIFQNGPGLKPTSAQFQTKSFDASADGTIKNTWSWVPVLKNGLGYGFGTKMTATIEQGTTRSWKLDWNLSY